MAADLRKPQKLNPTKVIVHTVYSEGALGLETA